MIVNRAKEFLCSKLTEKMMNQSSEKCETTKTDSNFPPSLQSSWKNEFVVRIKRKRKKHSMSHTSSTESGIIMRNTNPLNDRSAAEENNGANNGIRKYYLCGRHLNAKTMSEYGKNIFSLLLIIAIFNTQITYQRPVHNNVEEGSLTSAMVSYCIYVFLYFSTFHNL